MMHETDRPHPEMPGWISRFYTAPDGLSLHIAETGPRQSSRQPVLCLSGLTRNAMDFGVIGSRIAAAQQRRVIAVDYRGRGLSAHDPDWTRYDLMVELDDLTGMMNAFGLEKAIFLGTSRGGLLTMLTAITRPGAIHAAILNDIGAVFEARGLARVRGYVGKIPEPRTLVDGIIALRQVFGGHFPDEPPESWEAFARRVWREENGRFVPRYDTRLMKTLEDLDLEKPVPPLWPQFNALKPVPLMVIRGELSDLFAQATAEEMVRRHPEGEFKQAARLHIVPRQGHAPLLEDEPTIAAILDFLKSCDPA